jgi:hypothetical protein
VVARWAPALRETSMNIVNTTSRRIPLAASLAAVLGFAAADARATCANLSVTSCADSGPGTLRSIVSCADSGDTVDLSALSCGTIALAGRINVLQADLSLNGPGANALVIDGGNNDRIFSHHILSSGAGTLLISGLTLAHGRYVSFEPQGGCVASGGNVTLSHSVVTSCAAIGTGTQTSAGGGIYAYGAVTLAYSTVSGNIAQGTLAGSRARGGGISVQHELLVKYSTIRDNTATAPDSRGGGIYAPRRNVTILASTISGNTAAVGAGVDASIGSALNLVIKNSTLSGNTGTNWPALYSQHPTRIDNSTIAFNRGTANGPAVGVFATTLNLQSSILADNTGAGLEFDLGGSGVTLTAANNLVRSPGLTMPGDTIGACPRLGPLAANGGPTLTHALLITSPALEMGNNSTSLNNDQRGIGFVRSSGAIDIGAYERQAGALDDRVFKAGFEAGCDE